MRLWTLLALLPALPCSAQVSVLTYHNDLFRSGVNANETTLTPANVASSRFGKRFSYTLDGVVYAQPLYVPNVPIPGQGTHNVVYVVTEHDTVYALDADANTGAPLWQVSFLGPGVTTVPSSDVNCGQVAPEIGMTATPVIDPASGTIYVVPMTKETFGGTATYVHRLHALDIATGAERPGSPVEIQVSVPGKGDGGSSDMLIAKNYKERAGLMLLNGIVYTTWASHCDEFTYHGWVIAYDAPTLQQTAVYNNTPNGRLASFWNSGAAPAADAQGNIYVVGGNGTFDANTGGTDLGNSFVKLTPAPDLSVADYFTPFNYDSLNQHDLDIGSSGALLLPDSAGSSAHPHLLVSAGKEGRIYVLDRDNLGQFQQGSDSQIVQSLAGAIGPVFGIPTYFNNTLYFSGVNDKLKAFPIQNAQMATTPSSQSALSFGQPGGVPSISANGVTNGIVWMAQSAGGAALYAWDATDLTKILFNSNTTGGRDSLGSYVKFSTPTIANGKVYVGTQNSLVVYGLTLDAPQISAVVNSATYQPNAAPGSIVSIFGSGLAAGTGQANRYPLPTMLSNVSVSVNGTPAPLYYVSPGQINAQVPYEAVAGRAAIAVTNGSGAPLSSTLPLTNTAPGIFLVVNQDGSVNSASQPAPGGSTVSVYLTGIGPVAGAVTGSAAPSSPPLTTAQSVTTSLGTLTFAGLAPGYAGLAQINLTLPVRAPGAYPLTITVAGAASNTIQITLR